MRQVKSRRAKSGGTARTAKKPAARTSRGKTAASQRRRHAVWLPRLKLAFSIVLFSAVVITGYWMVQTNFPIKLIDGAVKYTDDLLRKSGLAVQEVDVEGAVKTKTAAIMSALAIKKNYSILGQSLDKARRQVEQLDWVRSAAVMRQLPSRLKLFVQEREPVAIWQYQQKHYLIDADGEVITDEGIEEYVHLPVVVGKGAAQKAPVILHLLSIYPNIQDHMRAIVYVNEHRWDIWTESEVVIKLPEQGLEDSLKQLDKILESGKYLSDDVQEIDLRISNKVIVRAENAMQWLSKRKIKKH